MTRARGEDHPISLMQRLAGRLERPGYMFSFRAQQSPSYKWRIEPNLNSLPGILSGPDGRGIPEAISTQDSILEQEFACCPWLSPLSSSSSVGSGGPPQSSWHASGSVTSRLPAAMQSDSRNARGRGIVSRRLSARS